MQGSHLDEARRLAIEAARLLMAADLARGHVSLEGAIEVVDSGATRLIYVTFFGEAVAIESV